MDSNNINGGPRGALLALLLCVIGGGALAPAAAAETWQLEFGPYVGRYGFDSLTRFDDFAMFGARLGVRVRPWLVAEGGFDEVYTSREITDNRARQVSLTLRTRLEPWSAALRPYALVGAAVVFLDDSEDPDAWGDALDLGLGLGYSINSHWFLRGEWLLRRQGVQLLQVDPEDPNLLVEGAKTLWGRSFSLGVSRVF
jgi:Outer membrane protein beta-barrel domain